LLRGSIDFGMLLQPPKALVELLELELDPVLKPPPRSREALREPPAVDPHPPLPGCGEGHRRRSHLAVPHVLDGHLGAGLPIGEHLEDVPRVADRLTGDARQDVARLQTRPGGRPVGLHFQSERAFPVSTPSVLRSGAVVAITRTPSRTAATRAEGGHGPGQAAASPTRARPAIAIPVFIACPAL